MNSIEEFDPEKAIAELRERRDLIVKMYAETCKKIEALVERWERHDQEVYMDQIREAGL